MTGNFFKPRFRVERTYDKDSSPKGFIVLVRHWWFPVWVTAMAQFNAGEGRYTSAPAFFNTEEDACEYIVRRYRVITDGDDGEQVG